MPIEWLEAIGSVVVVSLVSLIGVALLFLSEERLKHTVLVLVGLAVGGLLGDAFIHLLPEAFRQPGGTLGTSLDVLAGIFAFFILEKSLRWRHGQTLQTSKSIQPVGYINLITDGVHNVIDGILIGASYLVSRPVGLATTIAVVFHEIPHEIGNFGVLIHAGFSKQRALLFNFLTASLAIAGTIFSLLAGARFRGFTELMLPVTAGGFIYIAGSDLLPELLAEDELLPSAAQLAGIAVGIGLMLLLALRE
jgi:zinc and cadmium transporter